MVDTPEKNDDDSIQDPIEDKPAEAPPKGRCQRRRSRSRREKESNTGTGYNNTPENVEYSDQPVEPAFEQDEWEEGHVNPDELVDHEDSEDSNYISTGL